MTSTDSGPTTETDVWNAIAAERRRLADDLEGLTDEQWRAASQCEQWTVGEVATHLVVPLETSLPRFMFTLAKHRGKIDKAAIDLTARAIERNTRGQVITKLRDNATNRWTPPGFGPEIPLSEIVVHGEDIRRPLGIASTVPDDVIDLALRLMKKDDVRADYAARVGR